MEGDSSDLSIVVSSDSFSDDLASSGELDDKTILRSVEAIRRRTALAVGDGKATRRVQSARRFTTDHKWIETTHSSSLKPKTNSVKVQLQRKRVFLGTLIDECTYVSMFFISSSFFETEYPFLEFIVPASKN